VDSHDFVQSPFGRPGRSPGPAALSYCVYLPRPIPRSLQFDEVTTAELSNADRALGRLAGSGRLLKNPFVLANVYIRREAVASTRLDDLYEAESGGAVGADVQEVINYVNALYTGLRNLSTMSITVELLRQLHVELLAGVRGEDKQPGVIRDRPNWIGSNDPATARFVPPPHSALAEGLADWESFAGEDVMMPPLVKCALLHYQFETLHPFLDGNGRLGRLLIILFLVHDQHLPAPLLYLSTYFEHHKDEYYDALQGVRERGDIQTWLRYFLRAVSVQANDAVRRSERLMDLGDEYRQRLSGSRSRAHELVDRLLSSPWITTQHVRDQLGVTNQGAVNLLRQLEGIGILRQTTRLPGRSNRWVAHEAMAAVREETPEIR
jgi:Fic family protein